MNKSLNSVLHKKNISLKKYNNFKIEAKALRKLRHPSRSRKLKDFLID